MQLGRGEIMSNKCRKGEGSLCLRGTRTRYGEIWNKWLNPKGIEEQRGISAY